MHVNNSKAAIANQSSICGDDIKAVNAVQSGNVLAIAYHFNR